MLLLSETLRIRPEQTKTTICYEIVAPQDFDRIEIDAEYSPKFVTDTALRRRLTLEGVKKWKLLPESVKDVKLENCPQISNMITLSLDINGKFCGYAHRHDPVQHIVVSKSFATPGFHAMAPEKGTWRLMLPVCMAATPEILYHIRVSGLMEGDKS